MFKIIPVQRTVDDFGSGAYGASRGRRVHNGIDFYVPPGSVVCSPVDGRITKYGYCYSSDLHWRYIQITDSNEVDHRLFYVETTRNAGTRVFKGEPVGMAQDIASKYDTDEKKMTPHVHYEIKRNNGFLDPEEYYAGNKRLYQAQKI